MSKGNTIGAMSHAHRGIIAPCCPMSNGRGSSHALLIHTHISSIQYNNFHVRSEPHQRSRYKKPKNTP